MARDNTCWSCQGVASPLQRLMVVLNRPLYDLVGLLKARIQQLESQQRPEREDKIMQDKAAQALSQARLLSLQAELQKGQAEVPSRIYQQILSQIDAALRAGLSTMAEAEARYIRGGVYADQERFREATAEITHALHLDPALGDPFYLQTAYKTLSDIAERQSEYQNAVEYLEKAIEGLQTLHNPAELAGLIGETHCHLSLLYASHQAQLESAEQKALAYAQRALDLAPEYPVTYFALGALYSARTPRNSSDRDTAINHLERYLRMIGPTPGERTEENRWASIARQTLASLRGETPQEERRSGCFIATAVYGNVNHPDVLLLRRFRDEALLPSAIGRSFVCSYYLISPVLAAFIRTNGAKLIIKTLILRPAIAIVRDRLDKRSE